MTDLDVRMDRLTAALAAAGPEPGHRIAADYYTGGSTKKKSSSSGGSGRKVASKAGEKRYGLPIGTPLDGTHSKAKGDAATRQSYETFMAADTPADQRKSASWMSTDELGRAAEALFSFDSTNERDVAARLALVRELADRGIDPRKYGYKGARVVLNPNPKKDPTVRAAETAQREVDRKAKQEQTAQAKAQRESEATQAKEARTAAQAEQAKVLREQQERAQRLAQAELSIREDEGRALSQGLMSETQIRDARNQRAARDRSAAAAEDVKAEKNRRDDEDEAVARGAMTQQQVWAARRARGVSIG